MIKSILPCLAALLLTTSVAHAMSFSISNDGPGPRAASSFKSGVGPVADTCTKSDPWNVCDIDELTARCDAAGGGMSSKPGGGVDCNTDTWAKK